MVGEDRRTFLRSLPWLMAVLACDHARAAPAAGRGGRRGRVLVLGAGICGLAAARELASRGFEVVVLEARDRVGGRLWTDESLGVPVDLGAAWIEGIRGNPITALADRHGVAHAFSDADSLLLWDADGRGLNRAEREEIRGESARLIAALEELTEELDTDISVAEGIRRVFEGERPFDFERRALDWFVAAEIEADAAAPASELSLLAEDDEEFPGDDHLLHGGYGRLAAALARGLDVRLRQEVRRVAYGRAGVRVEAAGGAFEADAAVVTLPLGVLRAGAVVFDPTLPSEKRAALQGLAMGLANKVVLAFPEVRWPRHVQYLGYLSSTPGEFPVLLSLTPFLGAPVLVAYVAGEFARELERRPDAEVVDGAVRILRTMLGPGLPAPTGARVTRWGADPFTRGAYSFLPVGGRGESRDVLAQPVGARLFFAGEATSRSYPGTVHGAYLSGLREAERIARTL